MTLRAPRRPLPEALAPVLALALAAGSLLPSATAAASPEALARNWPAWRGPLATGVAPQADPPVELGHPRHLKWKTPIPGRGTASPVVWEDQVFLLTAVPAGASGSRPPAAPAEGGGGRGMTEAPSEPQRFVLLALDRQTGRVRWEKTARQQLPHEGHHKDHGFASASAVTDGEVVIAHFNSYGTYAYDLSGRLLWEKDLGDMRTRNGFGEGSSPALHGETVVILWDHEGEDFVVALDRRTGRELWRQAREEPTGWSTPLVVDSPGGPVVVVNGTHRVRAYDLQSGEPRWECAGQTVNAIPSPVPGHGRVYVMSGYRGAALQAITLGRRGNLSGTDALAWSHARNTPYVPSPLLYGDRLYFFAGNNATLSIFQATDGRPLVDAQRLEGLYGVYASPVGAAGRVYVAGRDGGVWVLKDGPGLEVLAKARFEEGFDASPAVVGRQLFLRGRQNLYCLAAE